MVSRSPGIRSRAIRELPAMPGRCIVRSVIGNASGPRFDVAATGTTYVDSLSCGAAVWFANNQFKRSRPTSSQL
jgi:hypothetical protein